jgi:hypothetical protein
MSQKNGSLVIPIVLFLALFLVALPVSANNVTMETNVTITQNPVTTTAAPVTTNETMVTASVTTVPPADTTIVPSQTTVAAPVTTVAAAVTTLPPASTTVVTLPTTVIYTEKPVTTGSVNVYSSPTGASILIDGIYTGTTPKTVTGVPAGNHILRLTMSGYHDYEGSIYVVAGQTAQGYGTLQPVSGQFVSAAPTQAVVVPVVVPVVAVTTVPAEEPGLLGNSSVIVAIIGVVTAIIAAGASIFTHVKPPKKE